MSLEQPGLTESDDGPTSGGGETVTPPTNEDPQPRSSPAAEPSPPVQRPLFDHDLERARDLLPRLSGEPLEPAPAPVEAPVAMAAPEPEPDAPPVATVEVPPEPGPDAPVVPEPVESTVAMAAADPAPAPTPSSPPSHRSDPVETGRRGRRGHRRARKVSRILRHVDPWSVLKVSLLFYLSLFLVMLLVGVLLWGVGRSAGAVDRVESFVTSLGFGNCEVDPDADTTTVVTPASPDSDGECGPGQVLVGGFHFEGGRLFAAFALGGLVLAVAGTAANTLLALLFNAISDLTGGVRLTILEEEPIRRPTGSPR